MDTKNSGFEYEKRILDTLRITNIIGNIQNSAGSNSSGCDADFKINGNLYNLEIKLDAAAQMGGSSVKYNLMEDSFLFLDRIEPEIQELLLPALETKKPDIIQLINFIFEKESTYNKKIPILCTVDTWSLAKKEKLLINVKIPFDTNFIAAHYQKKNVFYVQIGGAGLFYLSANPANLPIPKLEGNIDIEIRTGRSGVKPRLSGIIMVSGGLRVQGRLKTKNKSPHTLDTIDGVQKLLEVMGDNCHICSDGGSNLNSTQEVLNSSIIFDR